MNQRERRTDINSGKCRIKRNKSCMGRGLPKSKGMTLGKFRKGMTKAKDKSQISSAREEDGESDRRDNRKLRDGA